MKDTEDNETILQNTYDPDQGNACFTKNKLRERELAEKVNNNNGNQDQEKEQPTKGKRKSGGSCLQPQCSRRTLITFRSTRLTILQEMPKQPNPRPPWSQKVLGIYIGERITKGRGEEEVSGAQSGQG